MVAYRRVYDSRHPQADCQEQGSAPRNPTLGNRVWATCLVVQAEQLVRCVFFYSNDLYCLAYLSSKVQLGLTVTK